MKIAVITDIHSNHTAFQAAVDYLEKSGINKLIFLGDYVSDFPYPQKTMQLLYYCKEKFDCVFLRGNREEYMLEMRKEPPVDFISSSSRGSIVYTYLNLFDNDLDFFEGMPSCREINIDGFASITACHASPSSSHEYILRTEMTAKYLSECSGQLLLCGHAHESAIYELDGKKAVFCPAVGFAKNNHEHSEQITLIDENGNIEFVPIEYDRAAVANEFEKSGLINCGLCWSRGVRQSLLDEERHDKAYECVCLANKIAAEQGVILSEEHWSCAAEQLGIL